MAVSAFDMQAYCLGTDNLVVEELEVPDHDGTRVPLSLIYKRERDLKKDGNARAITERINLFAAAISNVSCSKCPAHGKLAQRPRECTLSWHLQRFGAVHGAYEMDAFQHVKPGTKYPVVLCIGGMNDPRLIVWQPDKFAALQASSTSGRPVLLQVNYDNSHFTEYKKRSGNIFAGSQRFLANVRTFTPRYSWRVRSFTTGADRN